MKGGEKPKRHIMAAMDSIKEHGDDVTPPAAVEDLTAEPVSPNRIRLSWTTPADAAVLQMKWASLPIVEDVWPDQRDTHANWWSAEHISTEPTPTPGQRQSLVVDTGSPGTRYFALRSFDRASNRSKISNVVHVEVKSNHFATPASLHSSGLGGHHESLRRHGPGAVAIGTRKSSPTCAEVSVVGLIQRLTHGKIASPLMRLPHVVLHGLERRRRGRTTVIPIPWIPTVAIRIPGDLRRLGNCRGERRQRESRRQCLRPLPEFAGPRNDDAAIPATLPKSKER